MLTTPLTLEEDQRRYEYEARMEDEGKEPYKVEGNDPRKNIPCEFHWRPRGCRLGDKCLYSHKGKPPRNDDQDRNLTQQYSMPPDEPVRLPITN